MTIYSDTYYILTENTDGLLNCKPTYRDIEKAKQHAKSLSEQLNMTCLIVKPIAKVTANTKWIIEDLN